MTVLDVSGIGMTSERTRRRMLDRLRQQGITDKPILEAMLNIPRHLFIDEAISHRAYEDTALPIGFGQTISQPYVVARMTAALLAGGPCEKILEIGTGSGYQAAILSQFAESVYTVERIRELQQRARSTLRKLNIRNVFYEYADGQYGYQKQAPYDGIIITAAPKSHIPDAIFSQLKDGGRLIAPIGTDKQELKVMTREGNHIRQFTLDLVRFVPLLDGIE